MPIQRGVPPSRWIVSLCIAVSVISMVCGWIGDFLWATLVDRQPLLLIALNPRNRNLILVTNQLAAAPYYLVGFFRLVASDPINYLLGFWFGDRALKWAEGRLRTYGPWIRDGESWFQKLAYPIIFFAPNNIVCALAGATGVRVGVFAVLNIGGTVTRLVLVRQLGEAFASPLGSVVDFIGQYRIPILVVSAIGVAWTVFSEFRGKDTELQALRELNAEAGVDLDPESPHEGDTTQTEGEQ